jgi:hypothetical protein
MKGTPETVRAMGKFHKPSFCEILDGNRSPEFRQQIKHMIRNQKVNQTIRIRKGEKAPWELKIPMAAGFEHFPTPQERQDKTHANFSSDKAESDPHHTHDEVTPKQRPALR